MLCIYMYIYIYNFHIPHPIHRIHPYTINILKLSQITCAIHNAQYILFNLMFKRQYTNTIYNINMCLGLCLCFFAFNGQAQLFNLQGHQVTLPSPTLQNVTSTWHFNS